MEARVRGILRQVYGEFGPRFPKPLSAGEAGPSADGQQRRYLWTDAFGVLGLVAISRVFPEALLAAKQLVEATETCLGRPRGPAFSMQSCPGGRGFVGLRIGKVQEDPSGRSDAGMTWEGQYWHCRFVNASCINTT
jgi:hypothetical protein